MNLAKDACSSPQGGIAKEGETAAASEAVIPPPSIQPCIDAWMREHVRAGRLADARLEGFYSIAYGLYSQGRFSKALPCFTLLVSHRPLEVRYLKAFAACQLMCGFLREAGLSYAFLRLLAPQDPDVVRQQKRCQLLLSRQSGNTSSSM